MFKQLYYQLIDNFAPMWFLRLQYSERYILAQQKHIAYLEHELSIRGSDLNDAIAKWEWHRDRADRFHRRAQKAEGMIQTELIPGLQELINLHQHNSRVFHADLTIAENLLREAYPALDPNLQQKLRAFHPDIAIPPKPETFNKG